MEIAQEILGAALIASGSLFMLVAGVGLLRLDDFYIRTSSSSKATTLGLGLILSGVCVYENELQTLIKVLAILVFIILITPLAGHVISRSALKTGVPFHKRTHLEDLEGHDLKPVREGEEESSLKKGDRD